MDSLYSTTLWNVSIMQPNRGNWTVHSSADRQRRDDSQFIWLAKYSNNNADQLIITVLGDSF